MKTLAEISRALADGVTTSIRLVGGCLARISDPDGEGSRAFIKVYADSALAQAAAADSRRRAGTSLSAFDGIPISVKDLFDLAGEVTRAGSIILADAEPALEDAPSMARLRAAGFIFIGRTNMTEFAYGGHGINAHYGTPWNPWDRAAQRVPGGSTSGGAVSVTDGMAAATIGSDTGGSVRIPAALCGLAGYKPTQSRVPLAGAFPLSFTRDSIGPLGHSAACCIALDCLMAGLPMETPAAAALQSLRFGLPRTLLLDNLDDAVGSAFSRAIEALRAAGASVEEFDFPELAEELAGSRKANFSAVEAYALHRQRLEARYGDFDPMVAKRLMTGATMLAADYVDLLQLRKRLIASADARTARFDALLAPTIPIVAPRIAEFRVSEAEFYRLNAMVLRNCAPFNVLNRPCWSLPCHRAGEPPVGLMVVGHTDQDDRLQTIGLAVERILASALT